MLSKIFGKTFGKRKVKGLHDNPSLEHNVIIELRDEFGNLKETREFHNTTCNAGQYGVVDQIAGVPALAKVNWCAIGTGSPTGITVTDKLGAEVGRVAFTSAVRTNNAVLAISSFGAGVGTGALTEAGLFGAVTANTVPMWFSATFAVMNKGANDTITVNWTITLT